MSVHPYLCDGSLVRLFVVGLSVFVDVGVVLGAFLVLSSGIVATVSTIKIFLLGHLLV